MGKECWKDVVGFEEYFRVSSEGRVWSKRTDRVLKPTKLKTGYLVINTRIGGRDGKVYSLRIHRLVAEAFLSEPNSELKEWANTTVYKKVLVNHKDGDKCNNSVYNLEWCDGSYNYNHSVINLGNTGHIRKGVDNSSSKLTEDDVIFIRSNYVPRCSSNGARALSRKFNVAHSVVLAILKNKTWKHLL